MKENIEVAELALILFDLVKAVQNIDCSCSISERESGHRTNCWMPDLAATLEKVEARVEAINIRLERHL